MLPSAKLILAIANRIALSTQSKYIQPIHLFLAILQILDEAYEMEAQEIGLEVTQLSEIEDDVIYCKKCLMLSDTEITQLRRSIRKNLPFTPYLPSTKSLSLPRSEEVDNILKSSGVNNIESVSEVLSMRNIFDTMFPMYEKGAYTSHIDKYWDDDNTDIQPQQVFRSNEKNNSSTLVLDTIGRDLTKLAIEGKLSPVVGRDSEMISIARILSRISKRNVILIGEAGVGKTAIVEGLAQRFTQQNAPAHLRNSRIIQINVSDLVAGTTYRGEMEERLQQVIEEVLSNKNIILFLDEIHLVMKSGSTRDSSMDIANILKPALARDDFRCIGATTADEYERYIKSDAAFMRRFQTLYIGEPDIEVTVQICRKWAEKISQNLNLFITEETIREAVNLSVTYIPNRRLPDKAIDLLENAATLISVSSLDSTDIQPNASVIRNLTPQHIREALELYYGISSEVKNVFSLPFMMSYLKSHIVGQENAIEEINNSLLKLSLKMSADNQVLGSLLFYGPAGGGKSYTAECIAKSLYEGKGSPIYRIFMSQFEDKYDLSRLIGSAPGLIGSDEQGALFKFINTNPHGVIILIDFEKAHPVIQNYFIQLLSTGYAVDNHGRSVSFKNYLFIVITNVEESTSSNLDQTLSFMLPHELLAVVDATVRFERLDIPAFQKLFYQEWNNLLQKIKENWQVDIYIDERATLNYIIATTDKAKDIRSFLKIFERTISIPLLQHIQDNPEIQRFRIDWQNNQLQIFSN